MGVAIQDAIVRVILGIALAGIVAAIVVPLMADSVHPWMMFVVGEPHRVHGRAHALGDTAALIARRGRRVRLVFEADGFLYKMVRSLTGTLINAGLGKISPREIEALLKSAKRTPLVQTAPPQGLFLVKVDYE